jgi:Txe/YoeB family toxin of toxin-antitoxin system
MFFNIVYSAKSVADLRFYREECNKNDGEKMLKKCKEVLENISKNPRQIGANKAKPIKGVGERDIWSRRINHEDRIIYEVFKERNEVLILSCRGRYEDF